jgi:hypothetical protein
MNKDDIIRLAREALLPSCHLTHPKALERFAALVAATEREACAKVCLEEDPSLDGQICATAIRARVDK